MFYCIPVHHVLCRRATPFYNYNPNQLEKKKPLQIHLLHPGLRQLVHATPLFLNLIISHFFPSFRPLSPWAATVLPLGLFLKKHLIKVPHPCTQITQQYQLGVTLGTRHSRWNQVQRQTNHAPCPLSSAGRHTWRSCLWLPPFKRKSKIFIQLRIPS